jgi:alkyl hydroperoxide reductase subunit F
MYDLIIVGGGPAGIAAGVYASRKRLRTLFITRDWGGQSTDSLEIQNWIGTPAIAGTELAKRLKEHLETYADGVVEIKDKAAVTEISKDADGTFMVALGSGESVKGRTVLIATGSQRRKLPALGADVFEHKGLTYCATCDGPLFAGQDVAVIGAGNAAFETSAQLLAYAKSVTLFQRGAAAKADPVTMEKVLAHPTMKRIENAEVTEVYGNAFVSGLKYTHEGATHDFPVSGIFVEIGMVPNTELVKDILTLDAYNRIEIDPWTQRTSVPGIWAAGDCTNVRYHQNNISAGDAVKALEDIYMYVKTQQ